MLIDIVVPIYNAFDELNRCLISLEKNQQGINQILLINDASTDLRISPLINDFALRNHWDVIESNINRGFVKTANIGLKESFENTILLNSDTIVTKNWIFAFQNALRSSNIIGTITPWSNNAEICSIPKFLYNNKVPKNCDLVSTTLYNDWSPEYPELPTAVGFCMLVSQLAKSQVGYFNETQFGHGYGEENDYSLRVKEKGLKNILCDNAYVAHSGNKSFVDLGLKPNQKTMNKLLELHPEYLNQIHEYIENDPLQELRNKIIMLLGKYQVKI
jgi:GT2 family glycosyltransferase